MILTPLTF